MSNKNLITLYDSKASISEAYRMCRTNLHYLNIDKEYKTIVVTSSNEKEGKSITVANLAIIMAQAGKNVLLIDCDMRKPRLHKLFEAENGLGLTHILVGDLDYRKAVKAIDGIENLFYISSGLIPPNPSEIIYSNALKKLLNTVKDEYDLVLIDAPPVCAVTDATILGTIVDGVILVIASSETITESAKVAVKALHKINATLLGVILTKVRVKKNSYYNYGTYTDNNCKKKKMIPKLMR